MFALIYVSTTSLIGGLGFYVYHLTEQRVLDQQTIAWLRSRNADRRRQIDALEEKIRMLEVF